MIRVAFTALGGRNWLGGRNYLVNLLRALCTYESSNLTPVLFVSDELAEEDLAAYGSIVGVEMVASPHFRSQRRVARLTQALVWGLDRAAWHLFQQHGIDVVFEPAQFYGWRLHIPAVAWVPDFQDRHLPHLFSRKAHLQKWLGQWAQALTGRVFLLSSEDSRTDCERFYPVTRGRTTVVPFSVPAPPAVSEQSLASIRALYELPETFFFLPNQLWAHKNHICVVRALKLLMTAGHEVVVAATGNPHDVRHGNHFDLLLHDVAVSGLTRHFRFLGMVPHEHVLTLMQAASALINPSRCEGWSTTVEEAKSTGTPMILSSLPVHQEQAGPNAVYFSPDSPAELAALLRSFRVLAPAERAAAAARARADAGSRIARFAKAFHDALQASLRGGCHEIQWP